MWPGSRKRDSPPINNGKVWRANFSGALALGLNCSGYMAETVRTGLQSVPRESVEAGESVGMTSFQRFRKIVFPQAIRVSVPLIVNLFAALLRWSSLVSAVGISELTCQARVLASETYLPAPPSLYDCSCMPFLPPLLPLPKTLRSRGFVVRKFSLVLDITHRNI